MLVHTRNHLSLISVHSWALKQGQVGFKLGIFVHVLYFFCALVGASIPYTVENVA